MITLIRKITNGYNYYFNLYRDPRQDGFFVVSNPFNMLLLLAFYWFMATKGGKILMKNRKPFQLKKILIFYNLLQVVFNGWFALLLVRWALNYDKFTFVCLPVDYSTEENGQMEYLISHLTVLIKSFDMFDTLFLVLSKKPVSFLHVFHHSSMVLVVYIMSQFVPGGQAIFHAGTNLVVHVFMYFYYFLTSINAKVVQSDWWKKNVTHIQIIQFFINNFYSIRSLMHPNCKYPAFWLWVILFESTALLMLFSNFYYKTYIRRKPIKTQ